jgi:protein-ribulosamine 3-kinase
VSFLAGIAAVVGQAVGEATGQPFEPIDLNHGAGGCINHALILAGRDGRRFFVKFNDARHGEMFAAEAEGLAELEGAAAIRVPRVLTHGVKADHAFLVLESLPLGGHGGGAELGRRLAGLHRATWHSFGWRRDNTIGTTPQPNPASPDWLAFFRDHRLGHQLKLASRNGAPRPLVARGELLRGGLRAFFPGYQPVPSLLHGDLWGGNHGYVGNEPVLFDPAVYYGDREADLAMTELFGGFPRDFYAAYREAWPLDPGYATRKILYNLYHVLNHFNLFGGGYADQARDMVERLLAESGG